MMSVSHSGCVCVALSNPAEGFSACANETSVPDRNNCIQSCLFENYSVTRHCNVNNWTLASPTCIASPCEPSNPCPIDLKCIFDADLPNRTQCQVLSNQTGTGEEWTQVVFAITWPTPSSSKASIALNLTNEFRTHLALTADEVVVNVTKTFASGVYFISTNLLHPIGSGGVVDDLIFIIHTTYSNLELIQSPVVQD